jgi:hypothetical protein
MAQKTTGSVYSAHPISLKKLAKLNDIKDMYETININLCVAPPFVE